jgi:hypothetical protein
MRSNIFVTIFLLISSLAFAQKDVVININDIAPSLKKSNQDLYEGATQVYKAKARIQFSRNSLLPKLNLWRLSSVLIDWKSAGEVLSQDLVPFLVPSNWLRVKQAKLLSDATVEGFHGLQKNIIFQTKLIYFQLQKDVYQLELQKQFLNSITKTKNILEEQIHFSQEIKNWHEELKHKKNQLELDLLIMDKLIMEERLQLSIMLGLATDELMKPVEWSFDSTEESFLMNFKSKQHEGVNNYSCELKQFDLLIQIAPKVKREIYWNILGVSETSRGVSGGVFDDIPIQDGLGFGMGASLKIHKSQVELLKRQRDGVAQVLSRQEQSISYNFGILKSQKIIAQEGVKDYEMDLELLKIRFSLGERYDPIYQTELEHKLTLQKIAVIHHEFDLRSEHEKLKRLFELDEYKIE